LKMPIEIDDLPIRHGVFFFHLFCMFTRGQTSIFQCEHFTLPGTPELRARRDGHGSNGCGSRSSAAGLAGDVTAGCGVATGNCGGTEEGAAGPGWAVPLLVSIF
jgi:hypothetical protein